MSFSKLLALGAALLPLAAAKQPLRGLSKRDDPYPFCDPNDNPNCIDGGRYLVPILDWAGQNGPADSAYDQYLPTNQYTLDQWDNGQWPQACQNWGVGSDHFTATDFVIYNVTYPDQCDGSPWVVCYHSRSSVSIDDIATTISRIPVRTRQAVSTYMSYSLDNPDYNGAIATLAGDGIIMGRSDYFFTTALVHEHGHAVDSNLVGVNGGAFSASDDWMNAINADYCAVSAYGAGSAVEDFAETGRAVLLDNIFPGGLQAFSNNNPNLTQITNQVSTMKNLVGDIYVPGGNCDLSVKVAFPALTAQS